MRKYNKSTKKTMIIISILFVVIIAIFSYAIKKSIDIDKTAYKINAGAIMFDKENNKIATSKSGIIKIKWGGDYYLKYDDKNYDLGAHSIVYNSNNSDINLYGKYYEVTKTGKVEIIKGENIIKVSPKFYKLADRKYLIIDRTIESKNSSFVTSNYLIVNLDKLGNATLLNDKTSYKTISPTVLRTSSYTFDIANEKINFGAEDIDLKKIIGSTNEYDEETYNLNADKDKDEDNNSNTTPGSNNGNGSGNGNGNGNGNGTDNSNGIGDNVGNNGNLNTNNNGTTAGNNSTFNNNNNGSAIGDNTVQQIINATRNTSVIRVTPSINSISIDYVVYDPLNEYKSVYVEVENTTNNQVNTVYLSKTDTNINISDLTPNVYYNLTFKYTYNDENKTLREYKFDEIGLFTEIPKMILTATKISNNKLYYKISLDKNYTITGGTVNLYLNDQFTNISSSISTKGNVNTISGNDCYIDLSSLNLAANNTNDLTIRLVSLSFNTYTINPSLNYKFRY